MASVLIEFFGDAPLMRVIDFLVENRGIDYSKTEIARGAEIGWSTLFKIWNRLEKNQIVKKTRVYGNTKLYTLNTKSPVVEKLLKMELDLIKYHAGTDEKELIVARNH